MQMIDDNKRFEGLIGQTHCPDCHKKLIPISKISEEMTVIKNMAVICMNYNCWRFTQLANLMTWKKA